MHQFLVIYKDHECRRLHRYLRDIIKLQPLSLGIIIKYASSRLKNDLEVAKVAMQQSKKCYEFLSDELKQNEQILQILKI